LRVAKRLRQDAEISDAFGFSTSVAIWLIQSGELQHLFLRLSLFPRLSFVHLWSSPTNWFAAWYLLVQIRIMHLARVGSITPERTTCQSIEEVGHRHIVGKPLQQR
jgi:hypothetical protein